METAAVAVTATSDFSNLPSITKYAVQGGFSVSDCYREMSYTALFYLHKYYSYNYSIIQIKSDKKINSKKALPFCSLKRFIYERQKRQKPAGFSDDPVSLLE